MTNPLFTLSDSNHAPSLQVAPRAPRICLPRKSAKKGAEVSLVLDLDETLGAWYGWRAWRG